MDDTRRVAMIDRLTINNGITLSTPVVSIRYQYGNHLGSASLELDQNAAIISYEEYHPFGTTSYRSGRTETEVALKRYKYVGKERDEERRSPREHLKKSITCEQTGLYYYGARYYAAWIARFVSVDPLQLKYPHYTPYQYAGNKPVSYIDLDGLEEEKKEAEPEKTYVASLSEVEIKDKKVGNFEKAMNFTKGIFKGMWEGTKNTVNFFIEDAWKIETWKGMGNLLIGLIAGQGGNPANLILLDSMLGTQTYDAVSGLNQAIDNAYDTLANGSSEDKGKIVGQAIWTIFEGLIGSKGAGALSKTKLLAIESKLGKLKTVSKIDEIAEGAEAARSSASVLTESEILRIKNAATRINKPINVVGSRAKGIVKNDINMETGRIADWDYIIDGLTRKQWKSIKNSLPGTGSIFDNTARKIDLIKEPLDLTKPHITIYPK